MPSFPDQRNAAPIRRVGLQLGESVAANEIAAADQGPGADELAAPADKDGRSASQACSALLAAVGRGASEPATVRRHAAQDLGITCTGRLKRLPRSSWSGELPEGNVGSVSSHRRRPNPNATIAPCWTPRAVLKGGLTATGSQRTVASQIPIGYAARARTTKIEILAQSNTGPRNRYPLSPTQTGTMIVRPIFILAAPRSSSVILRRTLMLHRDLWHLPTEATNILEGPFHPARSGFVSNQVTADDLDDELAESLRRAFYRRAVRIARLWSNPRRVLVGSSIPSRLRNRVAISVLGLLSRLAKPAQIRFLDKTNKNTLRVGMLNKLFPDALFI